VRVRRLKLKNFRGVANGVVTFAGHALLVGGNNIGKSTVCEALDLVLGPERIYRRPIVDEHDFHNSPYIGDDAPIDIRIEAVLTDSQRKPSFDFVRTFAAGTTRPALSWTTRRTGSPRRTAPT
jgi:putative ATP-dependent endonuclease of OLD family